MYVCMYVKVQANYNTTQLNCGFISITKMYQYNCNEEQVTITVDAKWRVVEGQCSKKAAEMLNQITVQ